MSASNRGDGRSFGKAGAGPSRGRTCSRTDLVASILQEGGATVDPRGNCTTLVEGGFAVALPGFEERVAAADLTIRRIKRFATRHAAELHDENRYVGVWVNGPTVYLDVSEVVVDQVAARTMGRARNQIALHAFAPFQVIWPLTEQVPA